MTDRFNRDEMFYRLAHLNVGIEKKEEVLKDLKKVSNPNFQDSQGTSYLHMACQVHSVEAISILLDLGADANISDERGFSPILSALGSINENNNIIFEMMLQHGLDLDKIEGESTLKEQIKSFDDEGLNKIIQEYSVGLCERAETTYLPYDLEFVYIPEGKYNKGLSVKERQQAREINKNIIFEEQEMNVENGIFVSDILVTRTPILNSFAKKYIDFRFYEGEEKYAAYLKKESVDSLCLRLNLRLPTEIEWEYFVRAGSDDLFSFGKQLPNDAELEKWLSFDFSDLSCVNCNNFGLYGIYTGDWCMSAMRMSSKGFVQTLHLNVMYHQNNLVRNGENIKRIIPI